MRRLSADRGASLPGVILVVVGALLVAAAGILKWVIVPSQTKLPSNLNVNLAINGTYSGINNAGFEEGRPGTRQAAERAHHVLLERAGAEEPG